MHNTQICFWECCTVGEPATDFRVTRQINEQRSDSLALNIRRDRIAISCFLHYGVVRRHVNARGTKHFDSHLDAIWIARLRGGQKKQRQCCTRCDAVKVISQTLEARPRRRDLFLP